MVPLFKRDYPQTSAWILAVMGGRCHGGQMVKKTHHPPGLQTTSAVLCRKPPRSTQPPILERSTTSLPVHYMRGGGVCVCVTLQFRPPPNAGLVFRPRWPRPLPKLSCCSRWSRCDWWSCRSCGTSSAPSGRRRWRRWAPPVRGGPRRTSTQCWWWSGGQRWVNLVTCPHS